MKKNLSALAALVILFASCSKNHELPADPSDRSATTETNTTVTTESALKTAISNAKAGDVITVSGTIKLTATLQLLNSGTSSSKINFTGGTLDCSGQPSGSWGVKVNGSYWNVQNIHITKAPDAGIIFQTGGNNYVNN